MGKPRKVDTHLPACVYLRRGRYYVVRRGRWYPLGKDEAAAVTRAESFVEPKRMEHGEIERFALRVLIRARLNAKGRKIEFKLNSDDVLVLLRESGYRCAVTWVDFSLEEVGAKRRRPYAPSIDRIECSLGYVPDNCRMVCVAANIAMNEWGESVLLRMMESRFRQALDI